MTADRTRRLALTITTTVCLLALIATFNDPAAFTVALFGTGWIGSVAWALVTRSRLTDSEAENRELARVAKLAAAEAYELDQENMRLCDRLAEAELLAGTGRVPSLRVVPNGDARKRLAESIGRLEGRLSGVCVEHGDALITEPGGPDMPTLYGRTYCPTCQDRLFIALDALDENR